MSFKAITEITIQASLSINVRETEQKGCMRVALGEGCEEKGPRRIQVEWDSQENCGVEAG